MPNFPCELKSQCRLTLPLAAMNFSWFAKTAITTAFLGRLGNLPLAGATLGFTFANVTGFSVLNGLCGVMEPICGQAFGANNFKLLHKTLVMTTFMLLVTSVPIAFLWLYVDTILVHFGQDRVIAAVSKQYMLCLIPDLVVTSVLCPVKAYLSTQNITVPIMIATILAVVFHVPVNMVLAKVKGLQGIAMAVWITDLLIVILLVAYVVVVERRKGGKWINGGWWDHRFIEWLRLIKLAGPCCLMTCLEWWCYEIVILLTGHLPDATQNLGIIAIVLNFDYLLFSIMLSLSTSASVRVSNELGANHPDAAYTSTYTSLIVGMVSGFVGGGVMLGARGAWGRLYSRDRGVIRGVKRIMTVMAVVEVVNFPLVVCGGIVRGTARPWVGMAANVFGFYVVALPLGVVFGVKLGWGLGGLMVGMLVGVVVCLVLNLMFVLRIDWEDEARKAHMVSCHNGVDDDCDGQDSTKNSTSVN